MVSAQRSRVRVDFWRLYQSRLFYHRSLMVEEATAWKPGGSSEVGIGVFKTLFYVAEYLDGVVRLYTYLGVEDTEQVTGLRN